MKQESGRPPRPHKALTLVAATIICLAVAGCGFVGTPEPKVQSDISPAPAPSQAPEDTAAQADAGGADRNPEGVEANEPTRVEKRFSADEQRRMNVFLSNFCEASVESFEQGRVSDESLVRFAILHRIINVQRSIKYSSDGSTGSIAASLVDETADKYFGLTPKTRSGYSDNRNLMEIRYKDGAYQFPLASGEGLSFARVDAVHELPDGLLDVDATVYSIGSGATTDGVDLYGDPIRKINDLVEGGAWEVGTIRATAKQKRWDGKNTWELVSYSANW